MKQDQSSLKNLMNLGVKYEKKLNSLIQDTLNDKNFIQLANAGLKQHTRTLKSLREFNEMAAQQLNIPTKDDVARIARLAIQLEEKLDQIQLQLSDLMDRKNHEKDRGRSFHGSRRQPRTLIPEPEVISDEKTEILSDRLNLKELLTPMDHATFLNTLETTLTKRRQRRG
ncbi:hypothetical protein [Mesobacillus harenae]|uniref:hypothetical protein n=1 Tax=Mesobacillus harenae TaxID=2213203 RepID=UPI0015805BFA|nr:hypothetical protein [Mesobacillus harenae]